VSAGESAHAGSMAENSKVWFVTGASSGFGRAISEAALERGDRVVAATSDPGSLQDLVARAGGRALALELDVTDPAAARRAVHEARSRFGRVDVVVNNAGYGHVGAIEELGDDEHRAQLEVNLYGVINVTRAALPVMREQRSGQLVQMSSLNGIEGLVGGATTRQASSRSKASPSRWPARSPTWGSR
jgi:NAD(P)-dependent dehydrogenase (short-subunit alcohol dehydrogenase family)